ncbi:MAG TPA: hypothetical protein VF677_11900 [Flavobacterium sp.]|jgi:hypothetical protein
MDKEQNKLVQDFQNACKNGDFKSIFALADTLKECKKHDEIYITECKFCSDEATD